MLIFDNHRIIDYQSVILTSVKCFAIAYDFGMLIRNMDSYICRNILCDSIRYLINLEMICFLLSVK